MKLYKTQIFKDCNDDLLAYLTLIGALVASPIKVPEHIMLSLTDTTRLLRYNELEMTEAQNLGNKVAVHQHIKEYNGCLVRLKETLEQLTDWCEWNKIEVV